jgi:TonB family protein
MKKKLFILLFLMGFILNTFATDQIPERLIYNGDTLALLANPLEAPYGDSIRALLENNCMRTSCWNRYIAYWTVIEQQLYLTDIVSCCYSEDSVKVDLRKLFGDKFINGKVKADWVTQSMLAGKGEVVFYIHNGYDSSYQTELELSFDKGMLIKTTIYDNSKSKKSVYIGAKVLKPFIYSHINWNLADASPPSDKPTKVILRISADENGMIDDVEVLKSTAPIMLEQEAVRVIKAIPEWDVYFKRGKSVRQHWTIPIIYSEELRNKYSANN